MKYNIKQEQLKLVCINLSDEIKRNVIINGCNGI